MYSEFLIFVYLWFIPVDVICEKDIRKTLLLSTFQNLGPYFPLLVITIYHFLHPVIGDTNSVEEILDGIANILYF